MSDEHERTEERLAAYLLGSLDDQSERDLVDHLAGCSSCRAVFVELRESAADLALAAEPLAVPASLEGRIVEAARAGRAPVAGGDRRRTGRARIAVAAAAAVAAALGVWNVRLTSELGRQREHGERIAHAVALVGDPLATRSALAAQGVGGSAFVVARGAEGLLVGLGLSQPPGGHVFELWVIEGARPHPAAVFVPSAGVAVVPFDASSGDAVAITVERGPRGSPRPTSSPIFTGTIET